MEQLKVILQDDNVGKLIPYLKRCEHQSGDYLIREGDPKVANLFHRLRVVLLSQRVMHLTSTVRALERS